MQPAQTKNARNIKAARAILRVLLANKAARMPAAIAGLAVTACLVGALLPSVQKAAHSGPVAPKLKVSRSSSGSAITSSAAIKTVASTSSRRRSIDFYTGDVRASMFSEPVAPAPPDLTPVVKPVPPARVDPFADWNYTGTATIGDDKIAILENINTHDGVLLHVGDKFLGTKVSEISGSLLTFGTGATSKSLFVSMNTSYIPLSASAGFLAPKPANQPTAQGNIQSMLASFFQNRAANTAPAGGPSVTLPNGRVLSGAQLDRYNQRLNRGWNGNSGAGQGR